MEQRFLRMKARLLAEGKLSVAVPERREGEDIDLIVLPPDYPDTVVYNLIALGEGTNLEFKEMLGVDRFGTKSSQSEESVLREIAAFLNSDGGTLLIGVADSGQVVGIAPDLAFVVHNNEDGFALKLRQLMETRFSPAPHGSVQIGFEPLPEGVVCRVETAPALGVTYFRDDVYVRDGNRTVALRGRELVEWTQRRR